MYVYMVYILKCKMRNFRRSERMKQFEYMIRKAE